MSQSDDGMQKVLRDIFSSPRPSREEFIKCLMTAEIPSKPMPAHKRRRVEEALLRFAHENSSIFEPPYMIKK